MQVFGSNNFAIELIAEIDGCLKPEGIAVIIRDSIVSLSKRNYQERIVYRANEKGIPLIKKDEDFFTCINQSHADLVLVSEEGLWGSYELTRDEVEEFIAELEILIIQKSYGKGTYR